MNCESLCQLVIDFSLTPLWLVASPHGPNQVQLRGLHGWDPTYPLARWAPVRLNSSDSLL